MKKNYTTKFIVVLVVFLISVIYTIPSTPLWVSAFGSLSPDEQQGVPISQFKYNENADGSVSIIMSVNNAAAVFYRKKRVNAEEFLDRVSETIRQKFLETEYNGEKYQAKFVNTNSIDFTRTLEIRHKEQLNKEKIERALADSKLYAKYDLFIASLFPSQRITLGLDLKGGIDVVYLVKPAEGNNNSSPGDILNRTIQVIRNRIDQNGIAEPSIKAQSNNRVRVQLPGVTDIERIKRLLQSTAMLEFHIVLGQAVSADALQPVMSDEIILMSRGTGSQTAMWFKMKRIPDISGGDLSYAKVGFDEYGKPMIHINFNSVGGSKFFKVTSANVEKQLAIVLDGVVLSAPVIKQAISGDSAQITGNFSREEAEDLAINLRAGALPANLTELESSVIGPTLGKESIKAGFVAGGIGFLFVILFMLAVYKTCGVFACLALLFNSLIVFATLVIFGGTMTLPGIAGFILSVGMSVDANVIIFERMREEYYSGKTVRASIASGFDRAFSCILDSNITTLLIVAILYYFTSGSIRGFATTLGIGLIANLFTAVYFCKLCVEYWFNTHPNQELGL